MTPTPCVSCGVRAAHPRLRDVCNMCQSNIVAGLLPDVRRPCKPPGFRGGSAARTGADFATRFFSPEAVERRTAYTLARERERARSR